MSLNLAETTRQMTRNSMIHVDSVSLNVKAASILFRRMANYTNSKTAILVFLICILWPSTSKRRVFAQTHIQSHKFVYMSYNRLLVGEREGSPSAVHTHRHKQSYICHIVNLRQREAQRENATLWVTHWISILMADGWI